MIADSTATVIGAMIVAPLMTPILGTALAVVLADRTHVVRSVLLVLGGALVVIAIGLILGLLGAPLDGFATNGQVTARINPKLIDLDRGLGDGAVGAFALVRSDISDTLPGVAIAISLVPPLAVVGLLLSVQRYADAAGAALLFGTNVAAIIATGAAVFLCYRIRQVASEAASRREAAWPLARGRREPAGRRGHPADGGQHLGRHGPAARSRARPIAEAWASQNNWLVTTLTRRGHLVVTALGRPLTPIPQSCAPSSTTRAWAMST